MILVTGGAGYIGAVTVRALLKADYAVRVLDTCLYGDAPLEEIRSRIDLIQADICDFDESALDGIEAVIHLAGLSNDPTAEYNPEANGRMNTLATQRLALACKRKGIRRFIFASSCSIYDKGLEVEDVAQDEAAPVYPQAPYAASKYAAEQALLDLADDEFQPIILRQGTVYGWSPRMRYDLVINTFVRCAFEHQKLTVFCGGKMWRPLIDVNDVAACYLACLTALLEDVGGEIFNLAQENFQVIDLATLVKEALAGITDMAIDVDRREQFVRSYRVSTEKLDRVLGFQPQHGIADAARFMAQQIQQGVNADFDNPRYYNLPWLEKMIAAGMVDEEMKMRGKLFL